MSQKPHPEPEETPRPPFPAWKRVLVALAVVAVGLGFGLHAFAGQDASAPAPEGGGPPVGAQSLVAGGGSTTSPPQAGTQEEMSGGSGSVLSPLLVKGGFGFLVGFAMGFALRAFFKLTLLVLGIALLAIAVLSYAGVLTVQWDSMSQAFDSFVAWLGPEVEGFRAFLTGSLPSAAAGGLGLVAGFKR